MVKLRQEMLMLYINIYLLKSTFLSKWNLFQDIFNPAVCNIILNVITQNCACDVAKFWEKQINKVEVITQTNVASWS